MLDKEGWNSDPPNVERLLWGAAHSASAKGEEDRRARSDVRAPDLPTEIRVTAPVCRGAVTWSRSGGGWWRRGP